MPYTANFLKVFDTLITSCLPILKAFNAISKAAILFIIFTRELRLTADFLKGKIC